MTGVQTCALPISRVDNGFVDISGGYIHNTSNIDCDGNVSAQGVVKAGGVVLTSDQKQKKEIEDADINKGKHTVFHSFVEVHGKNPEAKEILHKNIRNRLIM